MVKTEKKEKEKKEPGGENRKEEEGAEKKMKQRLSVRNLQKKIIYSYRPKLASRPEFVEID